MMKTYKQIDLNDYVQTGEGGTSLTYTHKTAFKREPSSMLEMAEHEQSRPEARVSVFSDLNNLKDISMLPQYSTICGITEQELHANIILPNYSGSGDFS